MTSYVAKYGPVAGPIIYRTLQKEAAQAMHKARLRRQLRELTGR
jgi:hypothetical protein